MVYGLLGLILLLIGYYIYELITPFSVKEELITHRNPAVGMVVAAFILWQSSLPPPSFEGIGSEAACSRPLGNG